MIEEDKKIYRVFIDVEDTRGLPEFVRKLQELEISVKTSKETALCLRKNDIKINGNEDFLDRMDAVGEFGIALVDMLVSNFPAPKTPSDIRVKKIETVLRALSLSKKIPIITKPENYPDIIDEMSENKRELSNKTVRKMNKDAVWFLVYYFTDLLRNCGNREL